MRVAASSLVPLLFAAMAVAQGDAPVPPQQVPMQNPFRPFDRAKFEQAARQLGATGEHLKVFAAEVDEHGLARAADRLLRAAVPAYDAAVKRYEATDPAAALELTKLLAAAQQQPLLRGHVRYHLARVFRDSDDPERAVEVLGDYIGQDINVSPLDSEMVFFYAQSLADIPRPDDAIPRFRAFLQWFPDASERYRSAALQQIADLERQRESRLHELANEMSRTRRDLKKRKTDKPVQVEQEKFVETLQELIEMFEEMENQSSGAPSGNQQSQAPASESALPGGEARIGELQKRPTLADH